MILFGILYAAFNMLFGTIAKIDESIDNDNRKKIAKQKGRLVYSDHDNQDRLIENDRLVYKTTRNKDKVLIDMYTGKVYHNYTKEKEKEEIIKAQNNNQTVIRSPYLYRHVENYNDTIWYNCNILPEYKDINSGCLYIIIKINGINFYMDITNGHIIRPIDGEKIDYENCNVSIDDIITTFNKYQDLKIKDEKFKRIWWTKNEFYLDGYKKITIDNNLNILKEKK